MPGAKDPLPIVLGHRNLQHTSPTAIWFFSIVSAQLSLFYFLLRSRGFYYEEFIRQTALLQFSS